MRSVLMLAAAIALAAPAFAQKACLSGDCTDGQGSARFGPAAATNPLIYTGSFSGGVPDGRGRIDYAAGTYYEGDLVAGKKQGTGVETFPDGGRYEGGFVQGQRTGQGVFVEGRTGIAYTGEFRDGDHIGVHTTRSPDGRVGHYVVRNGVVFRAEVTDGSATAAPLDAALMRAIDDRDVRAVEAALMSGATPEALVLAIAADGPIRRQGDDRSVQNTDAEIVSRLLAAGAAVDAAVEVYGVAQTPLMVAAHAGRAPVVQVLLSTGASATAASPGGDRPIHAAAAGGDADIVQMLLDDGADAAALGAGGRTPLMAAGAANEAAAIGVLLAAGADPRQRSATDSTALDFARARPGGAGDRAAIRSLERALGERPPAAVWTAVGAPPCDAIRTYVTENPAIQVGDEAVYAPAGRTATYALAETPVQGSGVVREDGTPMGILWTRTIAFPSLDVAARTDWQTQATERADALAARVAGCLGAGYTASPAAFNPDSGSAGADIAGPNGLEAMRVTVLGADRSDLFMRYARYEIRDDDLTEPTAPVTLRPELYLVTTGGYHAD